MDGCRSKMHCVDLGSGDGALVRAAVREGGFGTATGYEINPMLVAWSQLRAAAGERYRMQSLWEADLSEAQLVFVYGVPSILGDLETKLCAELPAGSHVISNAFPIVRSPRGAGEARRLTELDRRWVESGPSMDSSADLFLYRLDDGAPDDDEDTRT